MELNRFAKQAKLFFFLKKTLSFKSDDSHVISRQEKRRLPKSTARFPANKRWHSLTPVELSWDSLPPPPESLRGAYADVIDRLPNLLINGTPLARYACGLHHVKSGLEKENCSLKKGATRFRDKIYCLK